MNPRQIAYASLFLALSIVFPLTFHQFGLAGRIFLPMHLTVLMCGFIVGPFAGLLVGLIAPFLSHLMTSMPPGYAVPLMTLELSMYGLIAGITYKKLKFNIYIALFISMVLGRVMFAFGLIILGMFIQLPYGPMEYIIGGVILTGWPGLLIQIIVIPPLMASIGKSRS